MYNFLPTLYFGASLHHVSFFFFNWIIALQYCSGFCHASTWISHRYTYAPSLSKLPPMSHPLPPLELVIELWVEFPVSHSKFSLAIYFTYGNAYVSMLLLIRPTLQFLHRVHKSDLYLCGLHFCPANKFINNIFLYFIHMLYAIFVFLFLTYFTLYNRF